MDPTPKRILIIEGRIPPRREIWSLSDGSHPEEKYDHWATDPTPKKIMSVNEVVRERDQGSELTLTLGLVYLKGHDLNNNNYNSHRSMTCWLRRR